MGDGVNELSDALPAAAPTAAVPRVPRFGAGARIVLAIALVVLLALIVLWTMRKPIAAHVIDAELAKRGIVARYGVDTLGVGRQRLVNVVIGDPAAPDLVADWLEADTHIGLDGARLVGVRAGHVRLRGRMVRGRLSLGALDRLMPPPSGQPFAPPALDLRVADARMRLETPAGVIGLKVVGAGRLDGGFAGRFALAGERLGMADCSARHVAAAGTIRSTGPDGLGGYGLDLAGPARAATLACMGTIVASPRLAAKATIVLGKLDASSVTARIATGAVMHPHARLAGVTGTIGGSLGKDAEWGAGLQLAGRDLVAGDVRAGQVAIEGGLTLNPVLAQYVGKVSFGDADVRRFVPSFAALGTGTPLAPLMRRASVAVDRAAAAMSGDADLAVILNDGVWNVIVRSARLSSASGARAMLSGDPSLDWRSNGRFAGDGRLVVTGGGLPQLELAYVKRGYDAPLAGSALLAPYAADGATLALAPVRFTASPGGATRVTTRATLSGPLGDGRVEGFALPLDLRWDGRARLMLNPTCGAMAIRRLAVAGLVLDPLRTTLCPLSGAMATLADGRLTSGVRLPATQLAGRLGQTPLTVAASGAQLRLADRGFAIDSVAARLGSPARMTRIDLGQLVGRVDGDAVAGTFTGGAGQIANVPLLMTQAAGDWSLRGGALRLGAAMTVADAAPTPRFNPLEARAVTLNLVGGAIDARGTLYEPTKGVKVADVTIAHALSAGRGAADIAVPRIAFTEQFQPDLLTRLTYGVVADVRAVVTGEGHIGWSADGVTSTGTFATKDAALAAAFGPVSGIATTIRFTDLLALASAPGQVATIRTVNPGIAVSDGTIGYQLLPDLRVQIDSGVWPFAGGRMTLLPTTLDFAETGARRMTFRLDGVEARQFLGQFDFKNLDATGIFDGELPMIFDIAGGRIENGHLTVRPGGGSLAYVGDLSQKDLGLWGNIAFQALKSLRYRNLTIGMNGPLAGEMVTEVRFAGVTQGQGAKSNVIVRRLQRLPFVFNIRIKAPFRGLLDSAQSFYDPRRLIRRNLPALLERQQQGMPPIQPPASGIVPPPKQD